MVSYYKYA